MRCFEEELEFTRQMFDIAEMQMRFHCVAFGPNINFIGVNVFAFEFETANEDQSVFELKLTSELFQRGISEPGALL